MKKRIGVIAAVLCIAVGIGAVALWGMQNKKTAPDAAAGQVPPAVTETPAVKETPAATETPAAQVQQGTPGKHQIVVHMGDKDRSSGDSKGNTVYPMTHDGAEYLSVRNMTDMLSAPVGWDDAPDAVDPRQVMLFDVTGQGKVEATITSEVDCVVLGYREDGKVVMTASVMAGEPYEAVILLGDATRLAFSAQGLYSELGGLDPSKEKPT